MERARRRRLAAAICRALVDGTGKRRPCVYTFPTEPVDCRYGIACRISESLLHAGELRHTGVEELDAFLPAGGWQRVQSLNLFYEWI